jgi:Ca-activated chloride channel family protein
MQAITSSGISFIIPNITRTNSGASIYLSILSTLVGNPPVMTISQISQDSVTEELKDFFSHVGRSSGSEDYLLELVENGEYSCMVNTESQVLALNRRLEAAGKDPMYILYPTDGVSIGDAPLYFVNNDSSREGIFLELQRYLLSSTVQEQLLNRGFRANYGGTIDPEYADVFKASYGIQIDRCLSPVNYPSMPVITEALNRYQLLFRKPTAIVFCLDYSGSMSGEGIRQLYSAMDYILDNEKTSADFLQFSGTDSVTVLGFSGRITGWETSTGDKLYTLQRFVRNTSPSGTTDIYLAALKAFEILEQYPDDYIKSVVLMTDGVSNGMTFRDFESKSKGRTIYPVYSITFGKANTSQLSELAQKTGGKVFDGVNDLTNAFREVRGYN